MSRLQTFYQDTVVDKLQEQLWDVHETARKKLLASADRQKKQYDHGVTSHRFTRGDAVWLHTTQKKKGISPKLQARWMGPFLVVRQLSDLVYCIQKNQRAKQKVVHYNRLKACHGQVDNWLKEPAIEGDAADSVTEPDMPGLPESEVRGDPKEDAVNEKGTFQPEEGLPLESEAMVNTQQPNTPIKNGAATEQERNRPETRPAVRRGGRERRQP